MIKVKIPFSNKIEKLAELFSKPIYAVGGYVRNYLIDKSLSKDVDLASAIPVEEIKAKLPMVGLTVFAEYKRTQTLVFGDENGRFEYTAFRKEEYETGGKHTPKSTQLTEDILDDAKRRDFKCNAIYYDLKNKQIVDLLGGVEDVKNRVIDTVVSPEKVFCSDGLRLMRLARFCAQLNFTPTQEVLNQARKNASRIDDISKERILAELISILESDEKYAFSDKKGHYTGLKILDTTGVLDRIIPELTLGRGMVQRKDFHDYDVLEHSLKTVYYAPKEVRLVALLHDIGKPFCMQRDGKFHFHAVEGERLAEVVLKRLKAPKRVVQEAKVLVKNHMLDVKEDMKECKIRRLIVKNHEYLPKLLALKQADFTACKDDLSACPTVVKWQKIYEKMQSDGTPFNISQLKISATELMKMGFQGEKIGKTLQYLFWLCVDNPSLNEPRKLLELLSR